MKKSFPLAVLAALGLPLLFTGAKTADVPGTTADVIVYGGTPSGVMSAVAAARHGLTVALVDMNNHVGGIVSGGLVETDIGDRETVGGLAAEFFGRIVKYYSDKYGPNSEEVKLCKDGIKFEPHVAEQVFEDMLKAQPGVTIWKQQRLDSVTRSSDGNIASILTNNLADHTQHQFSGKIFIDASYEGDLMAGAKVPFTFGRESKAQYGESLAGITAGPDRGKADELIQSFNYRVNIAGAPDNIVPFPKPEVYDPEPAKKKYAETVKKKHAKEFSDILASGAGRWGPQKKLDLNWGDIPSTTLGYADGDWATREKIAAIYRNSFQSMLYYLQNDPDLPAEFHEGMKKVGLPKDEFPDTGHFPFQLYVREARRMVGLKVMTERDITQERYKPDGIAQGSYGVDCHVIQEMTIDGKRVPDKTPHTFIIGYDIPYGTLVPTEATGMPRNLLVPVCLSTSHVVYCSLRMEPVFMMLGHAAGDAAYLALSHKTSVQKVDPSQLRDLLRKENAKLDKNFQPQVKIAWTPAHPKVGETVEFKAETGELRGALKNISWDFEGDGKVAATGSPAKTSFKLDKTYQVSLLVEDEAGRRRLVSAEVPVGTAANRDVTIDDYDYEAVYTGSWDGDWPKLDLKARTPDVFVGPATHFDTARKDDPRNAKARFQPNLPKAGRYLVCIGYRPSPRQATNVPVTIVHGGETTKKTLNEKVSDTPFPWTPLGEFHFPAGDKSYVEIANAGTDGTVAVDGIRWVWLGE